jgi:fatty-acyl-CoA synthase
MGDQRMGVSDWIDRNAGLTPDKPAIRFPGRDLSYAGLAALVEQLASALAARGVGRTDCVAYLGFNSPEMLALLFACAKLGVLFMPLNWRLAGPEHEQMLKQCPPSVLFVETPFIGQIEALRGGLAGATPVALAGASLAPRGWTSYGEFLAGARGPAPRDSGVGGDSALLICYTSGATGKPKGVVLTQEAVAWNAANSADMHGLTAEDRILTVLPMFHVGGLNILTTPALQAGCTVVLHPKFDPAMALDAIERERITLSVVVPAVMDTMMSHPRWPSADISSLRMLSIGSSIVPERLIQAVHARGVPMVQVYGSTETCPIAAYLKVEDAARKVGSTGRPAAHCRVRIVDDLGRAAAPGVTGEIHVQGPNLMRGYFNAPELTAAAVSDGWYRSGDMGHWDGDGYLFVDGRKKEMIISGGENIYPAEIENVLTECGDIAEAAVVGKADAHWGEIVVAVVVPRPPCRLDSAAVLKLLDGRIARFKHPKEVLFVDQLPKTALGKIRRDEVRRITQNRSRPDIPATEQTR